MTAPDDDLRTAIDERLFFRPPEHLPPDAPVAPVEPAGEIAPIARPPRRRRGIRPGIDRAAMGRGIRAAIAREEGLGTPFLFLPVGLLCGIVIYFALPAEPLISNLLSGLAVFTALAYGLRNRSVALHWAAIAGGVVIAGMVIAKANTLWAATPMLGSDVTTRLTGHIVAVEERANGRTRFTVDIVRTERPTLRYAPNRVRVTAPGSAEGYVVGGGIMGLVRLTSPSGPAHPHGYDFAFHSYFDGIGANGFFLGDPATTELATGPGIVAHIAAGMERLRQAIGRQILDAAPDRRGAVAAALVTGNKAGIPEDVTEALRVSGLAHILSISGLHMALVAATVMAALRFGFALAPEWSARHPVRKYAAAGALAATGFYLFLAGAGVATQRSFVMLAIMLLALTFDRNAVTMRNLALAALLILATAPHEAIGPGFQMSFAATMALIAVYGGWQDWREGRDRRARDRPQRGPVLSALATAGRYALGIAVTSLIAGVATGLFASYHFGRVAPYGLLANLAAMPVVTILVMPLAVAAMIAMPFGLHLYVFKAMAWGVGLVIDIAERVAALSPAIASGQMPAAALIAFATGLIVFCLLSSRLRWIALLPFAAGVTLWGAASAPVALLSEDARQFALIEQSGGQARLHVNRSRPSQFITGQWQEAYRVATIVKPKDSGLMQCSKTVCNATAGDLRIGYVFVEAGEIDLSDFCAGHDLVIHAKAPSPHACPDGTPVVTAQDLARSGAAEIHVSRSGAIEIRHALPGPTRPWLDHRQYSRAARNLADRR